MTHAADTRSDAPSSFPEALWLQVRQNGRLANVCPHFQAPFRWFTVKAVQFKCISWWEKKKKKNPLSNDCKGTRKIHRLGTFSHMCADNFYPKWRHKGTWILHCAVWHAWMKKHFRTLKIKNATYCRRYLLMNSTVCWWEEGRFKHAREPVCM